MAYRKRLALTFFFALILLLIPPTLASVWQPALLQAPAIVPEPVDTPLSQLGIRDEAYTFLADLGLYAPGQACATGRCQAWYCDRMIMGRCYQRNGDGSYSLTNPVGCLGNCGGGVGVCDSGLCSDSDQAYNCCAKPGQGGCGPILMGVRGTDCCADTAKATPTPEPTPTPPACDGQRTQVSKPHGGYKQAPEHVIVVGQDPGVRGFDLKLDLHGGRAERWQTHSRQLCTATAGRYPAACPDGPWRWACVWELESSFNDPIVKVEVAMRLHESSIAWIENELAPRYPGLRRSEPLPKVFKVWQGRAMAVRQTWHYLPSDPGVHGGRIILTTAGTPISAPQQISVPFEVKVYLKDTTLWEP